MSCNDTMYEPVSATEFDEHGMTSILSYDELECAHGCENNVHCSHYKLHRDHDSRSSCSHILIDSTTPACELHSPMVTGACSIKGILLTQISGESEC